MKKHVLAVAVLGTLSLNAFALPHATVANQTPSQYLLAEGGGDRLFERQLERLKVVRIAEGGGDRTFERQLERIRKVRMAEGGGDRLFERNRDVRKRG